MKRDIGDREDIRELITTPALCVLRRFGRVWLFVIPQTVARQVPLSMGFSRQEYWSGLPFSTLGDLQTQGSNLSLVRLRHCKWILYHWAAGEANHTCQVDPNADYGPAGTVGYKVADCLLWANDVLELARTSQQENLLNIWKFCS